MTQDFSLRLPGVTLAQVRAGSAPALSRRDQAARSGRDRCRVRGDRLILRHRAGGRSGHDWTLRATLVETDRGVLVEGRFSAASFVALVAVVSVPAAVLLALAIAFSVTGVAPAPVLAILWVATVMWGGIGVLLVLLRAVGELGDHRAAADFLRRAFPPSI